MQRALSIASALAMVALAAVLAWKSAPALPSPPPVVADAADAAPPPDAGSSAEGAKDIDAASPPPSEPTGAVAPALGAGSPRHVRFGVVLVAYEGAEGAPARARSRGDALAVATRLAEDAKADFHAAVQRGDSGSADDVGVVTRGVLEPGSEAVLFALPVGGVSEAIDTPRGFWIVKRLE